MACIAMNAVVIDLNLGRTLLGLDLRYIKTAIVTTARMNVSAEADSSGMVVSCKEPDRPSDVKSSFILRSNVACI